MIIFSTSLTVPEQPSPWFHVEAWLPFRNREMDYLELIRSHAVHVHNYCMSETEFSIMKIIYKCKVYSVL